MKNSNVENISISSLNSSKNSNQISINKKTSPHHTMGQINLEELNCSLNQNDISKNYMKNFNKNNKLSSNIDYSTTDINLSPDYILKKKKLRRKLHSSLTKENLNETQFAISNFRDKIDESSISMNDEKDNNYILTINDNSLINMNINFILQM